jgi:hypothetical protein
MRDQLACTEACGDNANAGLRGSWKVQKITAERFFGRWRLSKKIEIDAAKKKTSRRPIRVLKVGVID